MIIIRVNYIVKHFWKIKMKTEKGKKKQKNNKNNNFNRKKSFNKINTKLWTLFSFATQIVVA